MLNLYVIKIYITQARNNSYLFGVIFLNEANIFLKFTTAMFFKRKIISYLKHFHTKTYIRRAGSMRFTKSDFISILLESYQQNYTESFAIFQYCVNTRQQIYFLLSILAL